MVIIYVDKYDKEKTLRLAPAPYFRIFNPMTQIDKFDKQKEYINKWVPELQELTYPEKMVDHKMARERCLKAYKKEVIMSILGLITTKTQK